jgi:hypothetical protein
MNGKLLISFSVYFSLQSAEFSVTAVFPCFKDKKTIPMAVRKTSSTTALSKPYWLPKTARVSRFLGARKQLTAAASLVIVGTLIAVTLLVQGTVVHASSARNNEGLTLDTNTAVGNFDGTGHSYSQTTLSGLGFASGGQVTVDGISFVWPTVAAGTPDNWQSAGQVVTLTAATGNNTLGILGAASNGLSSGTATITYTDASVKNFTLTFSDWTLNAGTLPPALQDSVAVSMPYRNNHNGSHQTVTTYVFYTAVAINSAKTIKSLTLPATVTGGQLHVFAVGVGNINANNSHNNEGLTFDTNTTVGNFDTLGDSYSETALAALGFTGDGHVTVQGTPFIWPVVAAGIPDNWISQGQTLLLPATTGTALGFLGSATNGLATGTATVKYQDGTIQTFTLTFSDWTLNNGTLPPASEDTVAATLPYRNGQSGKQTLTTYLFYTSVALNPAKKLTSVSLPATVTGGLLHVFSLGIQTTAAPLPSNWTQYLGNNADTSYNTAESTITSGNVANLKLKWMSRGNKDISDQAIELNGNVYWGDYRGRCLENSARHYHRDLWRRRYCRFAQLPGNQRGAGYPGGRGRQRRGWRR